eukprot:CAMPEP_0184662442 /NCGR_PEP_ID=MMETSP0308-20130426/43255_1 /TAXON_ID=38269 /ORGANISM="Gloeochaete witrockiana, Strain SAG 46.84" /LENGTH=240 /DNA_ID=CAMNT_0027104469 /DNA_START=68 /DNA_END=790 /DNA_ORIENTATION=+
MPAIPSPHALCTIPDRVVLGRTDLGKLGVHMSDSSGPSAASAARALNEELTYNVKLLRETLSEAQKELESIREIRKQETYKASMGLMGVTGGRHNRGTNTPRQESRSRRGSLSSSERRLPEYSLPKKAVNAGPIENVPFLRNDGTARKEHATVQTHDKQNRDATQRDGNDNNDEQRIINDECTQTKSTTTKNEGEGEMDSNRPSPTGSDGGALRAPTLEVVFSEPEDNTEVKISSLPAAA